MIEVVRRRFAPQPLPECQYCGVSGMHGTTQQCIDALKPVLAAERLLHPAHARPEAMWRRAPAPASERVGPRTIQEEAAIRKLAS